MSSLLDVVRRVEDQPDKPTPQDLIRTLGDPAVPLGIGKRATKDQSQGSMGQLSLEMSNHVGRWVYSVALIVELFDRVRQL